MIVTVKFFASLAERVGIRENRIPAREGMTVAEVWQETVGQPMFPNTLSALNMEYCEKDQVVRDGDEVAFFPPVTGGCP